MDEINSKKIIRLSQGQLNLLETCPPQFQAIYLEQLASPLSAEDQEKQAWGSRFHLLMQQYELGLNIEYVLKQEQDQDQEMYQAVTSLLSAAPEIFNVDANTWRDAEHQRTLAYQNYLLKVVYDLLIANEDQARIFDWKTYLKPQNREKLAKNWQTRLYLYVLAETSTYKPEQISMIYWFVKVPEKPQSLTLKYSQKQHEQTQQDLQQLLTRLREWLKAYSEQDIAFTHLSGTEKKCSYCQNREKISASFLSSYSNKNWQELIKNIEEVPLF